MIRIQGGDQDRRGESAVYAHQKSEAIAEEVKKLSDNGTKALNDFVMPFYHGDDFSPGSTDVGDVSWLTPTVQFNTACEPSKVPGHSWQKTACGKSSFAKRGMLLAAKVIAATAVDLYEDPALLEAAKEDLKRRTGGKYECPIPQGVKPRIISQIK